VRDSGESCDDGNRAGGDGCSATCLVEACGNGVREGAESCDDGNVAAGDGCSATCSVEVATAVCGNGVREGAEVCDDGNVAAGDGCRANCTSEVCGDGIRDVAEACDDGNLVGGDGCRPGCSVEACGDGIHDANEGCDDGNLVSGDDCSSSCTVENDPGATDVYFVDAGGAGYTATDGTVWIADGAFVNGGRVANSSYDVRNTTNDALYQTRGFGAASGTPLLLNFPVTGTGPYRVRLHFAEMEPSIRRDMRVFNVVAEDAVTLRNLDVFRSVGPARPYVRDVYVNVDDGMLTLRFEPMTGEPMISGVEIIQGDPPLASPRFVGREAR
jgi:cysteine-rich repeat protein